MEEIHAALPHDFPQYEIHFPSDEKERPGGKPGVFKKQGRICGRQ
jgi:hypothetical protein